MKSENRDFFYFDPSFKGAVADFTDPSVFSAGERREFLSHYSDFLKCYHNLSDQSVKPVDEEAAQSYTKQVAAPIALPRFSKRLDINKMKAELKSRSSGFENWQLYTARAVIEENTVILKGDPLPPNPAAGYALCPEDNAGEFEISFYMDKAYDNGLSESGILGPTTHRLISVRAGIRDIININVFPNGIMRLMYPAVDEYNPKEFDLGRVSFGEWQSLKISLSKETVSAALNSGEEVVLTRKVEEAPDLLFFSTGMFQMGDWKIRPSKIVTERGEITEFFSAEPDFKPEIEALGEVDLPYSVGNYKNRDKILCLTGEFDVAAGKRAYLTVGSLDPGGRVYLDGELIAETDGFEELKTDITDKLCGKSHHTLTLEVDPRAPEVLFRWHRNVDPYNGWFAEAVTVEVINEIELSCPRVVTLEAAQRRARVLFSCKTEVPCRVNVYIAEAWPNISGEVLVGSYMSDGNMSAEVEFPKIELWEPEDPVLYSVRFEAVGESGVADDTVIETGFRAIEQKKGAIYLNGKKTVMKGALVMQYLPPHSETATTHICPRNWQIVWQYMMLKKMGGNTLRLHILGYGTNDVRFARYADRMGIMLIWTTRYIDSVEQMEWEGPWRGKEGYLRQISLRLNHPSIVMWEGSNEFHPSLSDIDRIHKAYVGAVKSVDKTRLLCPLSHHYYAGLEFGNLPFNYYRTDGKRDCFGNEVTAAPEWCDPLVVRSAHPYMYSMGYGLSWEPFRTQPWAEQNRMAEDKTRAYLATEFAIIGRQDPNTKEAREDFFQPYSYEFPNERVLGFPLTGADYRISQAYQALCISYAVRKFRIMDYDGMLWCCLMGGANDGGYLKPPIDNYGYAKYGFYTMKECFKTVTCFNDTEATRRGAGFAVKPVLFAAPGDTRTVTASVVDEAGNELDSTVYREIECFDYMTRLPEWRPNIEEAGYYAIKFITK